ncbi:MAG: spore germination protein [Bacillota bacterium]|nr:spore germination protein [Bacillota bacterium]
MPFRPVQYLRRLARRHFAAQDLPDAGEGPPPADRLRVEAEGEYVPCRVYRHLDDNEKWLRSVLGDSSDLVLRRAQVLGPRGAWREALVCYMEALADPAAVADAIMRAVTYEAGLLGTRLRPPPAGEPVLVHVASLRWVREWREVLHGVLSGDTVLFLEGEDRALICATRGFETRTIEEPALESTLKGPREGFVESIGVNMSLLRRWVKTPRLRFHRLILGDLMNVRVEVAYVEGLAGRELVDELLSRLNRIKLEDPLGSNAVAEFISDTPLAPMPLVLATERPDRAAAALVEGRIVILVDNTPYALIVPCDMGMVLTSPEDHFVNSFFAFLNRTLRLLALIITLTAPGLYVALTTFHTEMLPTAFFLRLQAAREGVPLPSLAEAVVMGVVFELLREAGLRMPRQVGQAVSVVGALVIGDAAVRAAVISPIMLVVVGITAITAFAIPGYVALVAMWIPRLSFTVAAGVLGLFGLAAAVTVTLYYGLSLRSFGLPYFYPYVPSTLSDLKDLVFRAPAWAAVRRPSQLARGEPMRMPYPQPPGPPPAGRRRKRRGAPR